MIGLGKTGYDYGFLEWFFKDEAQRDALASVVETLGHGEKYDKTEGQNDD